MGMFDSVMVPCPTCGERVEFQSKEGECLCSVFTLANAPTEVVWDIINSPERCGNCGSWMALIDPNVPPGKRPRPNPMAAKVKTPSNPITHSQGFQWWPDDHDFTFDDLLQPLMTGQDGDTHSAGAETNNPAIAKATGKPTP